jgi:glutathione-specific gamma-glutamylcyclotransferase
MKRQPSIGLSANQPDRHVCTSGAALYGGDRDLVWHLPEIGIDFWPERCVDWRRYSARGETTAMPVSKTHRILRMSDKHVEAVTRKLPDPGAQVFVDRRAATDADYEVLVASLIAGAPPAEFWVFAYGSLIWNPAFDYVESRLADARGWRRTFCLGWDYRFRGNLEQPGLMLALDRGGRCKGVAYRLPQDALVPNLNRLVRREMSMVPSAFPPRWIKVSTSEGVLKALTFAIDRNSGRYVTGLHDEAVADVLASACGFWGSMADYLLTTVRHLEELGVHDRHLWKLQELVAERIERTHGL